MLNERSVFKALNEVFDNVDFDAYKKAFVFKENNRTKQKLIQMFIKTYEKTVKESDKKQ